MSVLFEVDQGVAVVTLNRPASLNAVDLQTREELREIWRQVRQDDRIQVAILTGAGEKAFCAGADLKNAPPDESFAASTFGASQADHISSGMDMDKPLICAVNGFAMGGGFELALACDVRLASANAQFALSEVRIGSIPGSGGTQVLPRVIGESNAMLLLLTGDRIDAQEAFRVGLVSKVVPGDALLETARTIALRIAENAPLSVRAIKRLVRDGKGMPLAQAMHMERYAFGLLRGTSDRQEGRSAFRENRKPQFQGR